MDRQFVIESLNHITSKLKKVDMIVTTNTYRSERQYRCPTCGNQFTKHEIIKYGYKWCYNCGQRVDFTLPENKIK